jgi:hypothetical protein
MAEPWFGKWDASAKEEVTVGRSCTTIARRRFQLRPSFRPDAAPPCSLSLCLLPDFAVDFPDNRLASCVPFSPTAVSSLRQSHPAERPTRLFSANRHDSLGVTASLIEASLSLSACWAGALSMSDWPPSPSDLLPTGLQLAPREIDPCCRAYQQGIGPLEKAIGHPTAGAR